MIESRYLVERRNRTIYKRMRDYLYALKHDERLLTSILPLGDGAASVSGSRLDRKRPAVRRQYEKNRITGTCQQSGSPENCSSIWGRCCVYRRRSFWSSGKSKKLFPEKIWQRGLLLLTSTA